MSDESMKNLPPESGTGDSPFPEGTEQRDSVQDTDADLDQKERSRLGRRFKRIEEDFNSVKQTISRLEQLLAQREEPARGSGYDPFITQKPFSPPAADDGPPEYITTPQDLERYNAWKQRREMEAQQAYVSGYLKRIATFGATEQDKELHAEVERELKTNVHKYLRHTGNPYHDADINYRIAKAEVLAQRYENLKSKPNVKGDRSMPPTGVTATAGRSEPPPPPKVELDEYARKFIDRMGASVDDEWVQASLKRTK